ncbi:MAG: NAD(+) synthase [Flavobacterium sp. BFFFF2]|nr:MAG: NAD(+) synthase [Flavobacterium sp. BFFFF2]
MRENQAAAVSEYIISWLRDYATKSGMSGFVVGISGGIDSAVTSSLCARTGLPTWVIEMPIHQASSHVDRAQEHIRNLQNKFENVFTTTINLTPVFEEFKQQVPVISVDPVLQLALANTRARLRMTTLYYIGGLHRCLVAGTGNKVEDFGVGFYTKYGDGGVDISPIADLVKSEVYMLGRFLQVPSSILIAPPTDGLFGDDRSDEDQIGASYDELEWAMSEVEKGKNMQDFNGREQEVMQIYLRLNNQNQHKMDPIPVCLIPDMLR